MGRTRQARSLDSPVLTQKGVYTSVSPLSTPFLKEIHVGDTSACTRLAYAAAEPHCGADTLTRDLQSLK